MEDDLTVHLKQYGVTGHYGSLVGVNRVQSKVRRITIVVTDVFNQSIPNALPIKHSSPHYIWLIHTVLNIEPMLWSHQLR